MVVEGLTALSGIMSASIEIYSREGEEKLKGSNTASEWKKKSYRELSLQASRCSFAIVNDRE